MTKPTLSVIMPVFNAEKYLQEAIDSILNQTFSDFELLILNDKSTDNSKAIIERNAAKDPRIVFIDKVVNVGPANLRNEGFETAQGTFVALMDADDISKPDRFAKQIDALTQNPEIGVCATFYTLFRENGKRQLISVPTQHADIKRAFLFYNPIGNPTIMLRKEVLKDFRFDNDFVPIEDYELWNRLLDETTYINLSESLLDYRWHDTNISQTKIDNVNRALQKIRLAQLEKNFGIAATHPNINGFLNALDFKRGLAPEAIIGTIEAAKALFAINNREHLYNEKAFEKQITQIVVRTIRKSKEYNKSFLNYLKTDGKVFYQKVKWIDRIVIMLKSM